VRRPGAPRPIPEAAATDTAARGGRLRLAPPAASAAETLDSASSLSYEYLGALCHRLVKLDEQGVTVPDLAEEWSATPGGVTWTFRLRRGVTFHDGRPFTAADVSNLIEHMLDPATASPQGEVLATMIGPGRPPSPRPHGCCGGRCRRPGSSRLTPRPAPRSLTPPGPSEGGRVRSPVANDRCRPVDPTRSMHAAQN